MNIMKLFKDKKVVIAGPCSFGTYEELDSITKKLKELNVDSDYTFIVAHVDALDAAKEYAQKIESQIEGAKVKVIDLVSAVGIHTGLGCLALQVFNEMEKN